MDADDRKGYAYTTPRSEPFSLAMPFHLGRSRTADAAAGTTIDELYIWHGLLNSQQIWQLYIQDGTM